MKLINKKSAGQILSVGLTVVLGVFGVAVITGAVTTISTNISTDGTLTVTDTSTLTGDVTMGGGNGALTLTTTNAATSTAVVGCYQTYATSTATAIHLTFGTAENSTTTSQTGTASANTGVVFWRYGACPI